MSKLVDFIGVPAMLEQTAEEATELAFACLKLARYIRGENKVHNRTEDELYDNLVEEIADMNRCFKELYKGNIVDHGRVTKMATVKLRRMEERLSWEDKNATKESEI